MFISRATSFSFLINNLLILTFNDIYSNIELSIYVDVVINGSFTLCIGLCYMCHYYIDFEKFFYVLESQFFFPCI